MSETLPPPDPEAFFAALAKAYSGPGYTEIDRYRDFRALFLGSDQGKRVLYQILGWGHLFRAGLSTETNRMFLHEGERNLALRIFNAVHVEPKPKPAKAMGRKPKEIADNG